MTVNIADLSKPELLVALYNRSTTLRMGFFNLEHNTQLTIEKAKELLNEGKTRFDYLYGRPMHIDIGGDIMDTSQYNRDAGINAAENVVIDLRLKKNVPFKIDAPQNKADVDAQNGIVSYGGIEIGFYR